MDEIVLSLLHYKVYKKYFLISSSNPFSTFSYYWLLDYSFIVVGTIY